SSPGRRGGPHRDEPGRAAHRRGDRRDRRPVLPVRTASQPGADMTDDDAPRVPRAVTPGTDAPGACAVICRDLRVTRDRTPVLHGVDMTVPTGEWVSLVGPNGSGKTTLLFALAGLIPSTGRVEVEGVTPRRGGRRRVARTVAMMPQRPVVPEGVT